MTLLTAIPGSGFRRPTAPRLFTAQLRHACAELWRTRVVFVFTFLFPLTWLVLLGFLIGDETVDQASGVRVMQFIVPTAAAMGVLYATLPTVATSLAIARETGVLKRVRGTPLPAWLHLAGRLGGSVVFAFGAVLTMLVTGVLAYGLQIVWRTAPATVVTLLVAMACFSALGLAVAGLARSSASAQVISIGGAVLLSFVSGLYTPGGGMPGWADRIASVLPLKPFMDALQEQFNPFGTGYGWDLTALAVMTAWAVVGGVIAAKAFRWAPARARRDPANDGIAHPVPPNGSSTGSIGAVPVRISGRVSRVSLVAGQVRQLLLSASRDPGWVFFAIGMPAGLFVFLMLTVAPEATSPGASHFGIALAAGMITWGTAVTAFINTPEVVARERELGMLKRLRGTPLPSAAFFAGRVLAAFLIAVGTAVLILAVGVAFLHLDISWAGLPLALGVLALGTATLAACGFVLVAVVRSAAAAAAVGLGILLPVAFFSGVFTIDITPQWMTTVGSYLPLEPVMTSLMAALGPTGPSVIWRDLLVLIIWLLVGWLLAHRRFRWHGKGSLQGKEGVGGRSS